MTKKFTMTFLQDNYTALHLSVEAGKSAVVEALLGHGAQASTLHYTDKKIK
jgi:hypothetical protein